MLYWLLALTLTLAPYQMQKGRTDRPAPRIVRRDVHTPTPDPICTIRVNGAGEVYDTCP